MSDDESNISEEFIISVIENSDFDCSTLLSDYKSIKINASDILKLTYNSMIIQYNNWFADVKTDFDENSARFFINHQKIILISIIFDEQLKIILNSVMQNNSDLSHYWQKFKHWFWNVIFHDNFDKLKLLKKIHYYSSISKKKIQSVLFQIFQFRNSIWTYHFYKKLSH